MTFIHGAACAMFCFGPSLAIYKATNLGFMLPTILLQGRRLGNAFKRSDQSGTRWLLSLAAIFYLFNLFAKRKRKAIKPLILLLLLPLKKLAEPRVMAIDLITAIMEINSIKYLLSHKTSLSYSAETRLLCIGLGWSLGHIICANGNLLLKAVGSVAFNWLNIFYALQASLSSMCYLSATALTFMASRRRMPLSSQIGFLCLAGLLVPWALVQKHLLGLVEPPKKFLADEVTSLCWISLAVYAAAVAAAGVATHIAFKAGQRQALVQKIE